MEIIKPGDWPKPSEWSKECECSRCHTLVKLEASDLRKTPKDYDPRDRASWGGDIVWDCPICKRQNKVDGLHESIESTIKESSR